MGIILFNKYTPALNVKVLITCFRPLMGIILFNFIRRYNVYAILVGEFPSPTGDYFI